MKDPYTGELTAYRQADGRIRLERSNDGPMRVSQALADQAEPELVSRVEDVLTFHGVDGLGEPVSYRYRIVGAESDGPEGGWLRCEPLP